MATEKPVSSGLDQTGIPAALLLQCVDTIRNIEFALAAAVYGLTLLDAHDGYTLSMSHRDIPGSVLNLIDIQLDQVSLLIGIYNARLVLSGIVSFSESISALAWSALGPCGR